MAHEAKKMCLNVKHSLTNEGKYKGWSLMIPSAFPFWELHLCMSYKCSKPWLEKQTSTKLGP